jgi:hypothetical protein
MPVGGFKTTELGACDVGNELNRVGETSIDTGIEGGFSTLRKEGRDWLRR